MPQNKRYPNESKMEFRKRQLRQKAIGQIDKNQAAMWIKDHGLEDFALGMTRLGKDPFMYMEKDQIANYQNLLKKRGFYGGEIDSVAGPMTKQGHKSMVTAPKRKSTSGAILDFMKDRLK